MAIVCPTNVTCGWFVPRKTTVFPAGGADLSGVVMLILVGAASHCFRAACAVATPPLAPPDGVEEAAALEEVEDVEDPHAASAAATTSAAAGAKNWRTRTRRLRLRTCELCFIRGSFLWYVADPDLTRPIGLHYLADLESHLDLEAARELLGSLPQVTGFASSSRSAVPVSDLSARPRA